jgi:hypothetical protein
MFTNIYAILFQESFYNLKFYVINYKQSNQNNKAVNRSLLLKALKNHNDARNNLGYSSLSFEEVNNSVFKSVSYFKFK